MHTFHFKRGDAFFSSDSTARPWTVTFEDEGAAGYIYACDMSRGQNEDAILDSMLMYNNASLEDPERQYLGAMQWSRDGMQCVFYIDGNAQAMVDFATRTSFCRSNFPNFLEDQHTQWRSNSHAWDDGVFERFEAEIYA